MRLESRLLLAGDIAADVAPASEAGALTIDSSTVVFIDSRVEHFAAIQSALPADAELVLIDPSLDGLQQISDAIQGRTNLKSIHLLSHGDAGRLQLGNGDVDIEALQRHEQAIRAWAQSFGSDADILLYGCNTGMGTVGENFLLMLADLTGADVAASVDPTGNARDGGDWILERSVGVIDSPIVVTAAARERFAGTLDIVINAWGRTGEDNFNLLIDGQVVQQYSATTTATRFVYQTDESITGDRVRIEFLNDAYDPARDYDRNLTVDNIQVAGVNMETEGPDVYSTGKWLPHDGIKPGHGRGDTLDTNGFFQYGRSGHFAGDDGFPARDGLATSASNQDTAEVGSFARSRMVPISQGPSAIVQVQVHLPNGELDPNFGDVRIKDLMDAIGVGELGDNHLEKNGRRVATGKTFVNYASGTSNFSVLPRLVTEVKIDSSIADKSVSTIALSRITGDRASAGESINRRSLVERTDSGVSVVADNHSLDPHELEDGDVGSILISNDQRPGTLGVLLRPSSLSVGESVDAGGRLQAEHPISLSAIPLDSIGPSPASEPRTLHATVSRDDVSPIANVSNVRRAITLDSQSHPTAAARQSDFWLGGNGKFELTYSERGTAASAEPIVDGWQRIDSALSTVIIDRQEQVAALDSQRFDMPVESGRFSEQVFIENQIQSLPAFFDAHGFGVRVFEILLAPNEQLFAADGISRSSLGWFIDV